MEILNNYENKILSQLELLENISATLRVPNFDISNLSEILEKIGNYYKAKNVSIIKCYDINFWELSVEWSIDRESSRLYQNGNWDSFLNIYNYLLNNIAIYDEDFQSSSEFNAFKEKFNFQNILIIPFIYQNNLKYLLAIFDVEKKFFHRFEIQILKQALNFIGNFLINNDKITFLQNEYLRLNDEIQLLSAQINLVPALIIQKSLSLKYEYVNEQVVKFLETSRFNLIGKKDADFFDSEFTELSEKLDTEAIQKFKTEFRIQEIKRKDKVFYFATYRIPFKSELTQQLKLLFIGFDITDFINEKAKIEKSTKSKSEFFTHISHEIRTPLNSIIGFTELLLQENLTDEQFDIALNIKQSSQSMISLINDILDLSKIEAGKIELNLTSFKLKDLVNEIKNMFEPQIIQKNIYFKIKLDEDLPRVIISDSLRLRQILVNLIANSIKFTKTGGIRLEISFLDESQKYSLDPILNFAVVDTGVGIEASKLNKIFEPYQQAEKDTSAKYGGTGLGLTISKMLVELFGGRIDVESQVGVGTKFSFQIQVSIPRKEKDVSIFSEIPEEEKKFKVLVIEDDPVIIKFYENYLRMNDYDYKVVTNGKYAIQSVLSYKPDTIILDILLPERNGFDILRDLKQSEETKNIPVIVCSMLKEQNKALNLGALEYLEKPISSEKLEEALNSLAIKFSQKNRIVLIDDDKNTLRRYKEIFSKLNYSVEAFERADVAIKTLVKKTPPSLIILDLMMPDYDGFQFMDEIRKNEKFLTVPIIVSTSKKLTKAELKKIYEKCSSVILKSDFNEDLFINQLNKLFKKINIKFEKKLPEKATTNQDELKILSSLNILIAEDNLLNQKLFASILDKYKIKYDIVNDGLECLNKLVEKKYDLILMDIQMPVMDGIETTKAIRSGTTQNNIPIIALTAHTLKSDLEQFEQVGMNGYILKPVDQKKMISEILKIMKKEEVEIEEISPYFKGFTKDEIIHFRSEYVNEIMKEIEVLDKKLSEKEFNAFKFFGHNIKGNGVAYGFPIISKLGAKIEEAAKENDYLNLVTIFNELKTIVKDIKV